MNVILLTMALIMAEPSQAEQAVALLQQGDGGILATIEKTGDEAQPYVSSTPFILDKQGRPVVFISDLALHTKNLDRNPHASIIVNKADKDGSYFNGSRVTVNGKMEMVTDEKEIEELRKLYMARYQEAEEWADFGDFNYYRMEIKGVYFIGGFGEIDWIDLDDYRKASQKRS